MSLGCGGNMVSIKQIRSLVEKTVSTMGDRFASEDAVDLYSNGFQCKDNSSHINNTAEFCYMAWARDPFKTARAR